MKLGARASPGAWLLASVFHQSAFFRLQAGPQRAIGAQPGTWLFTEANEPRKDRVLA